MQKKILLRNSQGIDLCGILANPAGDRKQPVTILCHGFSTSKDGRTYVRLEEILNQNGIATFRFDFFGHGESEGRFEDITLSESVDDVLNALEYIRKSGFTRIGLFGSSFGGMASILAASRSDLPLLLALKSPVTDYRTMPLTQLTDDEVEEWKGRGFIEIETFNNEKRRLNYTFYEDAKETHAYDAALRIKIPTLIVHGEADETVPVKQSRKAAKRIPDCRLVTIPGCDHVYSNREHFERMLEMISGFIVQNML
jgi:uncharacterized protein